MEQQEEQPQAPQPQQSPPQQNNEATVTTTMPERPAQEPATAPVEQQQQQQQQPIQDNGTAQLHQLPADSSNNLMPLPDQQQADPNGMGMGLGMGQFDPNAFIPLPQDMNFAAGANGMAFADPTLMMMAASQQMGLPNMPAPEMNGHGNENGITAGT
jgi:hypothetical protein